MRRADEDIAVTGPAVSEPAVADAVPGTPARHRHLGAAGLVVGAAALWGTTGTAQALGGAGDPLATGAARLAVGGGLLLLLALVTAPAATRAGVRRPLLVWTALGAVATAAYQAAFFSAVAVTGVATGTIVALGTAPVATGLCGALLLGERLTRWWAGATVLAVAGCMALVTAGGDVGPVRPGGVGLAVLAGAMYGLYTCAAKVLLQRGVPTVVAMGLTLGLGGVLLAPALVAGADVLTGRSLLVVAWLGLATTAVAYLFFARGLQRLPAGTVGTLSLAEPLTAAVLGLVVLGEVLTASTGLAALALLAGLVLVALRPPAATPAAGGGDAGTAGRTVADDADGGRTLRG